jgi:hypothetical protein
MLLSANQAARVLAEIGIARTQAQALLASGLAGSGMRAGGALLYDEQRVRELAARRVVDPDELSAACPHGLYIARIDRTRGVDVTSGWAELARRLALQPPMPAMTRALLGARMAAYPQLPWVATLCGYVVLGADALGAVVATSGSIAFTLAPPSSWFNVIVDRVLPTGRGGRPWVVWTPRFSEWRD